MTNELLTTAGIRLGATASSREEAVRTCGKILFELGAVDASYVDAMWERELVFSSYIGEGVAIPHGTDESRVAVNFAQLCLVRFADPIDWDGESVSIAIGIASKGSEHSDLLGGLAELLLDEAKANVLRTSSDEQTIVKLLQDIG